MMYLETYFKKRKTSFDEQLHCFLMLILYVLFYVLFYVLLYVLLYVLFY